MFRIILGIFFLLALLDTASAAFFPKAFKGKFIQEKKSLLDNKNVTQSTFNIKYQYPSNVYLESSGHSDLTYVCNRNQVWIYEPPLLPTENGTVKIGKTKQHCYSSLFDSLRRGLKSNATYTVKKMNAKQFTLAFTEKGKKNIGVEKVEIYLKSSRQRFTNINYMNIFYENDKHPTKLKAVSLIARKGFSKGTFRFKIPKNTTETKL